MKTLRIGMVGTFDVENFGDLLFPLLARHELARRLGPVEIRPFSYHARSAPPWPFDVTPLERLATELPSLDLLLVGGGDIIRFDRRVARNYRPTSDLIHHPTGSWLAPILMAHIAGVPVAWNAPGIPGPIPDWARPLVRASVAVSAYVSVRDAASQGLLGLLVPDFPVDVVPDTGFGSAGLLSDDALGPRPQDPVVGDRPDTDGYLVVQSRPEWRTWLRALPHNHQVQVVLTPVGSALGDLVRAPRELPSHAQFTPPLDPFRMLDLIAGSRGVVGTSLHLTIAALSLGRPAFRPRSEALRKYRMLEGLAGVRRLNGRAQYGVEGTDPGGALAPDPAQLAEIGQRLTRHWDTIASLATDPTAAERSTGSQSPLMMDFWQRLPATLERRSVLEEVRAVARAARRRLTVFGYTRRRE